MIRSEVTFAATKADSSGSVILKSHGGGGDSSLKGTSSGATPLSICAVRC